MYEIHGSPIRVLCAAAGRGGSVRGRGGRHGSSGRSRWRGGGYAIVVIGAVALVAGTLPAQRPGVSKRGASAGGAAGVAIPVCTGSEAATSAALASTQGLPAYVEATSAAFVDGTFSVFGSPTFFWHDLTQVFDSATATRMASEGKNLTYAGARLASSGAIPIPLPGADGRFVTPRVVEHPKGVALVVWGTTSSTSFSALMVDTVWQASFDGKAWTTPVPIHAGREIRWTVDGAEVFSDGERVHVALSSNWRDGASERSGPVMLRLDTDGWHSSQLPAVGMPPSEVVEVRGVSRPLQAFLGGGPVGGRVVPNGVMLAEHGGGPPAERLRLLHDGGESDMASLHAVAAGGVSYLMWIQSDRRASEPSRIEGYMSRDGGRSWRPMPAQPLPARARVIRPWAMDDGSILVISQADRTLLLYSSVWRAGAWSTTRQLPYTSVATVPTLLDDGGRLPILTWGTTRGSAGSIRSPQSLMVRVAEGCGA